MELQGKVAIITGASSGIGKACALAMAREGARVTIDYVGNPDPANQVVAEIEKSGGRALAIEADVTKPDDIQKLVDATVSEFGKLDIMQNNAGWEKKFPFLEMPLDIYQRTIAINLEGPWLGCQIAGRQMVKQGDGGRIINTSSVHEDVAMPTNAAYCAAKGGASNADENGGGRAGAAQHYREQYRPRRHLHPNRRGDRGRSQAQRTDPVGDPPASMGEAGGNCRPRRVPRLGQVGLHHRINLRHRRRDDAPGR